MKAAAPMPSPEGKLTQSVEISMLCDYYGGLLTERQRAALHLHYGEDWSYSEIAEHLGVSRQNVHDLLTRSAQKLFHYERVLGGVAQAGRVTASLREAARELEAALGPGTAQRAPGESARRALARIRDILRELEGEE